MEEYIVRRLMPIECSRLQGYPDEWLDLPHKETMTEDEFNEWQNIRKTMAEIEGKKYRPCKTVARMVKWYNKMIDADSNKYKALGNSIALPQWWWLFNRMKPYMPEDATLGSLFDGIGGFPLTFEECYGKGTAIWASEIEPYPIAVTKYHFGE